MRFVDIHIVVNDGDIIGGYPKEETAQSICENISDCMPIDSEHQDNIYWDSVTVDRSNPEKTYETCNGDEFTGEGIMYAFENPQVPADNSTDLDEVFGRVSDDPDSDDEGYFGDDEDDSESGDGAWSGFDSLGYDDDEENESW